MPSPRCSPGSKWGFVLELYDDDGDLLREITG
jgi:hypothetical protein